jgi:hypothetical protein
MLHLFLTVVLALQRLVAAAIAIGLRVGKAGGGEHNA